MKAVATFLAISTILSFGYAILHEEHYEEGYLKNKKRWHDACLVNSGTHEETLEEMRHGKFPEDPQLKQYVYCMARYFEVIDTKGELNATYIAKIEPPKWRESGKVLHETASSCEAKVKRLKSCRGDENEARLMRHLMTNYDAAVRPAENSSHALNVTFGVSLHHIIDVDEKNQILTTNCWITQIWIDHHLRWNVSDFAGIKVIRIPYNRVWRPDLILYNNADPQFQSSVINTNVIVSNTGEVVWLSHGIYRSSCDINVEYFPFDLQSCQMKWASWTYDGYQVELVKQSEEGDVSNYQANGEFDLISFSLVKNNVFYSCCPEPYPDITYTIKLKRRPLFYVFNLILPCILINGIALLVFYVPSESGEKVTLGISALLSMTVFLMTIRETLPPTEKTPLISMYYGVSICLVSFASGLSVVTLNIYHRGVRGSAVPKVLKNVVLDKLAPLVFLKFENSRLCSQHIQEINPQTGTRLDCPWPWSDKRPAAQEDGCCLQQRQQRSPRFLQRSRDGDLDIFENQIIRILNKVHASIDKNDHRLTEQERKEQTELEWKQTSIVLDRVLLAIFFLITIISTTTILCRSPNDQT